MPFCGYPICGIPENLSGFDLKIPCRHFFYLAPPFHGFAAHYYNYAHGLFQACREQEITFLALGATHASLDPGFPGDLPFRPLFHAPGPFCLAGIRVRGLGRLRNFLFSYRSLKILQNLPGFGPNAFCLIEEPRLFDVASTKHWLGSLDPGRCPRLGFLFRYGLRSADKTKWLPMREAHTPILEALEKASEQLPVLIFSDSHLVAEHLRKLTKLPVQVIPVHFDLPGEGSATWIRNTPETVHFYIPGIAATTKGTTLLVQTLQLLKDDPGMKLMRFTIPFYPIPHPEPAVDQTRKILEALHLPNVEILYESLTRIEYYSRLALADVILTPYEPDRYQATSGPFAEALAIGKPVIVSDNTWMSAMLEKGCGAGLTFPFADSQSLAKTLLLALRGFDELSRSAQLKKQDWIEKNGAQPLLQSIRKNWS